MLTFWFQALAIRVRDHSSIEGKNMKKFWAALAALLMSINLAFAVDANTASQQELESVKGIGPALSARIVDERKKGPFKDLSDLEARVKGIGETNVKKFAEGGLTVGAGRAAPARTAAKADDAKAAATAKGDASREKAMAKADASKDGAKDKAMAKADSAKDSAKAGAKDAADKAKAGAKDVADKAKAATK